MVVCTHGGVSLSHRERQSTEPQTHGAEGTPATGQALAPRVCSGQSRQWAWSGGAGSWGRMGVAAHGPGSHLGVKKVVQHWSQLCDDTEARAVCVQWMNYMLRGLHAHVVC